MIEEKLINYSEINWMSEIEKILQDI